MHFFILGGNGRTGSNIVEEALSRGHTLTALVRDLTKVNAKAGVTYIQGTPTSTSDITKAFENSNYDAVIVALNARTTDNPFAKSTSPPRLMADSVANTVAAMKVHSVKKIIVMQAFGVGSSFPNLNLLMRWVIAGSDMSKSFNDHNAVDKEVREAAADGSFVWTLVRPAMLKGEEALPVKVLGDDGTGGSFMPQCSRLSVARFIMKDCAETDEYDNRTPVICN